MYVSELSQQEVKLIVTLQVSLSGMHWEEAQEGSLAKTRSLSIKSFENQQGLLKINPLVYRQPT